MSKNRQMTQKIKNKYILPPTRTKENINILRKKYQITVLQ